MNHDSNHSTTMMIKSMMLILSINPQLAREIWFGKEFSCIITFVIILYHFLSSLAFLHLAGFDQATIQKMQEPLLEIMGIERYFCSVRARYFADIGIDW